MQQHFCINEEVTNKVYSINMILIQKGVSIIVNQQNLITKHKLIDTIMYG